MTDIMERTELGAIVPDPGRAELFRGLFTSDEMTGFRGEYWDGTADRIMPWGRHTPGPITDTLNRLDSADTRFPYSILCIERLGALAAQQADNFSHMLCVGAKQMGIAPHRDGTVGNPLSFIVVTSGEVDYRVGGFAFGGRHIGRYRDMHAVTGDVLVINNMLQPMRKKPLHSSANGTGQRLVIDLFRANDRDNRFFKPVPKAA